MRIIKPRTTDDIVACINMYYDLNDHSFVKVSKERSFKILLQFCKQNKFVRILLNSQNEIEAWIYADVVQPYHSEERMLQQIYYASNQKGLKAYRNVIELHNAMIEEAKNKKLKIVMSQGSHLDDLNVFTRILERNGWERRGHLALKRLA